VLLGQLAGTVAQGNPPPQVAEAIKLSVLGGGQVEVKGLIGNAASSTSVGDAKPDFLGALVPRQPDEEAREVLRAVAKGTKQRGGVALAKRLDKLVGARGRDAHIRLAGRAAGAAAILHSGLSEEAAYLAAVARSAAKDKSAEEHFKPSKELLTAWR